MNKMCRYLAKEWRKQLGVDTQKDEGEKQEGKQENGNSNKEKGQEEKEEKIKEEWLLCGISSSIGCFFYWLKNKLAPI